MADGSTAATGWRRPGAAGATAPPAGRGLAVAAAVAAAVLVVVAVRTFVAGTRYGPFSSDFPWLWRAGQRILDAGALPAGDPFSWTAAGRPWVLYQWLFEAGLAGAQRAFGTGGLVLLFDLIAVGVYVAAPVLWAVPRRAALPWTVAAGGAALAVASVNLSLRPMIATSALLLLQYVLVQR
ncbi:MAG: hypothetical protein IRY94_12310, partial [Rhodospirillaceae bacterium]|nr:hypothetical protein [Rhodospirillaceae bacterium]